MKKPLSYCIALLLAAAFCLQTAADNLEHSLSYRRFTTLDGLPQMQTEAVWQDSRGYIYIGTLSGFVRYDGRSLSPFLKGRRENIVSFQEVDGKVRALGFVRQWTVRGDKAWMQPIDPDGELLLNNFNAADLPPGYILLEDRLEKGRVLARLEADEMAPVLDLPLLDKMTPDRKMYVDSTGIYVPTSEGLFVAVNDEIRLLTRKADIYALIRTEEGLATFAGDGIWTVNNDSLSLAHPFRFPNPDYGLSVRQNSRGQIYIADAHTIWMYDGELHRLVSGFNLIRGILVDRWDRLWAATYQGAYCFFHCNIINHSLDDDNDIVRALAFSGDSPVMGTLNGKILAGGEVISREDDNFYAPGAAALDGTVYMAGNGDIAAVSGHSMKWLGLPYDRYRFVSAAGGKLIIGTRSAVLSYDTHTGITDTLTTQIVHPWCAVEDGEWRLWVSGNPGLYCLEGPHTIRKVRSTPSTLVITAMTADEKGTVCFAEGDSLFVIKKGQIRKMTELPVSGHEIRSIHISRQGYLVVAAVDGLLVARLDDRGYADDSHWFDSFNGFTTVEPLAAPMAEAPDGTIWLAGLEEMTSFHPEKLLEDNRESTFIPGPRPWWQHWWLWVLAAVLLSFCVWMAARHFEKRASRRKMEELEREKQLKELQLRSVRLKSIPHFHANVLSGIEYFVMNNSAEEASYYLKLYSDFTNRTLSDIERPARTVAEEVDYVRGYLELEKLRYGEQLEYDVNVARDVDREALLPTMLLHTYCENAVKHGISAKNGTGHIHVNVSRETRGGVDGILVSVADDGVGRIRAAMSGGHSTKQGLSILQQQIELYNRSNRYHIVQQVIDLADAEGHPAGTRFETWVPEGFQF